MASPNGTHYFENTLNATVINPQITHVNGDAYYSYNRQERNELMEWIKALEAKPRLIIWMYGPAVAGKSAIAQSIAAECAELGLLAASFFFGRTAAGRNDTTRVTIAYQISRFLPEVEDHLFAVIERDPAIFSQKLATQAQDQSLIIDPIKMLPLSLLRPILVIMDGVDECGPNPQTQAELLNTLGKNYLSPPTCSPHECVGVSVVTADH